jgi:O-antigen/teichoic acid export membrane protein
LVPHYGTLGAAFSTLIAFASSSVLSLIWLERTSIRYIITSGIAIFAGVACGYMFGLIVGGVHPLGAILISIAAALTVVLALKNTSLNELGQLLKGLINR